MRPRFAAAEGRLIALHVTKTGPALRERTVIRHLYFGGAMRNHIQRSALRACYRRMDGLGAASIFRSIAAHLKGLNAAWLLAKSTQKSRWIRNHWVNSFLYQS